MTHLEIPAALIQILGNSKHIVVLTGAGISAESGVPTFRDAQTGLWARYNPEELATPEAFQRDPKLVWDWYAWRRELVSRVEPNAGHRALVELERWSERHLATFALITQNVDGLHRQAGSQRVLELHGDLFAIKCYQCGLTAQSWNTQASPPPCPCGKSWLRPDVVWFGEPLPNTTLQEAEEAAARSTIFLSVGTSSLVYPAAGLPYSALRNGATVVEINARPTPLSSHAHFTLRGAAGKMLPRLLEALRKKNPSDTPL